MLFVGDDFVLTQTLTVMRYLARRFGFNGEDGLEEARADEVADLVYDLRLRKVFKDLKYFRLSFFICPVNCIIFRSL